MRQPKRNWRSFWGREGGNKVYKGSKVYKGNKGNKVYMGNIGTVVIRIHPIHPIPTPSQKEDIDHC